MPGRKGSLHVGWARHRALQRRCRARTRNRLPAGFAACFFSFIAPRRAGACNVATRDDDSFRVKPAPPKARSGPRAQRFVSQVLKQVSKAGANPSASRGMRPASTFGRGRVAAGMSGRTLGATARRVVIKSRYVVLKKAGANSVSTHLRYIERDGVTREGQRGRAYGPKSETAD